jgi:undecaprenyl-diphosphatase
MKNMKKFIGLLSVCISCFLLFVFYDSRLVRAFDDSAREFIVSLRNDTLNEIVTVFTYVGDAKVLGAICIIGVLVLFLFRKWLSGVLLLSSIGISYGFNIALKNFYGRERPLGDRLLEEDGFSFPSGNAMVGTSFYLFAAYLLYQRYQKSWLLWLGVILPFLLGLSRIYVGVHYPSDILAGFSIGVAFCVCLIVIYRTCNNKAEGIQISKNTSL